MKVVAFNGSPRTAGNTHQALQFVLDELQAEGIGTEIINIAEAHIEPCHACGACGRNKDRKCIYDKDGLNGWLEKMYQADGVLIGSPTYFGNMSPQMKSFIDRAGYVSRANGNLLRRKAGAAVAVNRRAGALVTFDSMNHFFLIGEMIVVGSSYWNVVQALKPGETAMDEEGVKTLKVLGQNMAWLIKKLKN